MDKLYEQLRSEVEKAQKILVVGHRKPDGDALGAMCAIKIWLSSIGKVVKLACTDKASKKYEFLPFVNEIETEINPAEYDMVIILDCGAHYMTNFHTEYPEILAENQVEGAGPVIVNIDHHASNDYFGHINIVDSESASATVILYEILNYFGIEITADIATCLLTGIYNDTGSFMHSNTSEKVYVVAGDLLKKGAKISPMIKSLFKTSSIKTLKLWGKAFSNAKVTDNNFILSVVKEGELIKGTDGDQLSGAIDYLNMVPDVDFALLIKEESGNVKGSLRTRRDDVDLSEIAKQYGGGGHPKAAGFSLSGSVREETHYKIDSKELQEQPLNL